MTLDRDQCAALSEIIAAKDAEIARLREQLNEWLKANAPGGWINDLREQRDRLADAVREFLFLDDERGLVCDDGGELVSAIAVSRAALASLKDQA